MMYVCYAGDDIATGISMSPEDGDYPATNALEDDPSFGGVSVPAKAGANSAQITVTTTGTAQAVFLFNTNDLTGATITVNGNAVTANTQRLDGHRDNPWIDLREILPASPIVIDIAAATAVQVGRVFVAGTLRPLGALIGAKFAAHRPNSNLTTIKGKQYVYDKGVRNRMVELRVIEDVDRQILEECWYSAKGRSLPWVLVPWHDRNDALWVRFDEDQLAWTETEGLKIEDATVKVTQWMGIAL